MSRFSSWDQQSWVRAKPHRLEPFDPRKTFYSADQCGLLATAALASAPAAVREALLVHALYEHLAFTVALETGPINEVCALLNQGRALPWLPEAMRLDALRIYADEGGHAEMTYSLMSAVRDYTGIVPIRHVPRFLGDLDVLVREHDDLPEAIVKVCFAVVSETLITGNLRRVPADEMVQPAVRAVFADHASDEGRHHAYFRHLFERMWPRLTQRERERLGPALPRMIHAFLSPDGELHTRVLASLGYSQHRAAGAVRDATNAWLRSNRAREDAGRTLQMFSDAGLGEHPATAAAFDQWSLALGPRRVDAPVVQRCSVDRVPPAAQA